MPKNENKDHGNERQSKLLRMDWSGKQAFNAVIEVSAVTMPPNNWRQKLQIEIGMSRPFLYYTAIL